MKQLLTAFLVALSGAFSAQEVINGGPVNVIDGVYIREHLPTKRPIECFSTKEEFVWNRRVWRTLESGSNPMLYEDSSGEALWSILKKHVLAGDLQLFSSCNPYNDRLADGDSFKYPVVAETPADLRQQVFSYFGYLAEGSKADTTWIMQEAVFGYRLKEDWFFDKDRSVLDVKILGIAPVICRAEERNSEPQELFWLYFPDCREILRAYRVPDLAQGRSLNYDALFWKRQFTSSIDKQSLAMDNNEAYRILMEALLESEKTTAAIRWFESDIWNF